MYSVFVVMLLLGGVLGACGGVGCVPGCCLHGAYVGYGACVVCAINGDM